ncbi:DNA integrity scanning protein DisA [Anoxybacter fermentans]|uniref:DNA integrity scanning protein DisA n=1 Tax=Anoxybacter fermentans TaxID=1323375 RepID=A0A3S9T2C4_9FIRM|nr:DNA integrity scanning diadenylate cyclase DisA [Anoxybacter fermentans]AZR74687.1 DNA integrity scanning protein DisA [Anoxybacter fermentans]
MDEKLMEVLKIIAPGTPFREGLENILRAKTGALIVVGDSEEVLGIVDGGFNINCELTPARLYELAKMDGAIILNKTADRILIANAQLVPDPSIASFETGIRHRTAERVARQTGELIISISQRRDIISLYYGDSKYVLEDIRVILSKGNQAIQTLEKYRSVLDKVLNNLSSLEFDDLVTLADVTKVLQRIEMVLRIQKEIEGYICELGTEGRLLKMQLEELMANVREEGVLIIRDYIHEDLLAQKEEESDKLDEESIAEEKTEKIEKERDKIKKKSREMIAEEIIDELIDWFSDDLLSLSTISKALGYGSTLNVLDQFITPRGYRLLRKIPRLPMPVIENLVQTLGNFQRILNASIDELDDVEGIGEVRAKAIKEGLRHLRDRVGLDKYV